MKRPTGNRGNALGKEQTRIRIALAARVRVPRATGMVAERVVGEVLDNVATGICQRWRTEVVRENMIPRLWCCFAGVCRQSLVHSDSWYSPQDWS